MTAPFVPPEGRKAPLRSHGNGNGWGGPAKDNAAGSVRRFLAGAAGERVGRWRCRGAWLGADSRGDARGSLAHASIELAGMLCCHPSG